MPSTLSEYLLDGSRLLEKTAQTAIAAPVEIAIALVTKALAANKPLLVCGNGGSAADSQHITGELVGRFLKERRPLKAYCLCSNPAVLTAWSNDYSFETVFARQVEAYGEAGGVLWAISTSGNSPNAIAAAHAARKLNMAVIGMTGEGGGKLAPLCDALIAVPSKHTPAIQQVHLHLYHFMCEEIERRCCMA